MRLPVAFRGWGPQVAGRLVAVLACLFLVASLLPLGSAQPGEPAGCEVSLDPQRCLEILDFNVTGIVDNETGQGEYTLSAVVRHDGSVARTLLVEFGVRGLAPDGNETGIKIGHGTHRIPAGGAIVVSTIWTGTLFKDLEDVSFQVRSQLTGSFKSDDWKMRVASDWGEPTFSLKPVWDATMLLEANTTTLVAVVDVCYHDGAARAVNVPLIYAGEDWGFTSGQNQAVLGQGDRATTHVHVRSPADAEGRDRSTVDLNVGGQDGLSFMSSLLEIRTPLVNGSNGEAGAPSVNENAFEVGGSAQDELAFAIRAAEVRSNRVTGLITQEDLNRSLDSRNALDDRPKASGDSTEEWIWYAVDKGEEGYDTVIHYWPNKLPGVVQWDELNGINSPGLPPPPGFTELMYSLENSPLIPSPPESPIERIASRVVGPVAPEDRVTTTVGQSESVGSPFYSGFPSDWLGAGSTEGPGMPDGGGPSVYRPDSPDSGDTSDMKSPLNTGSIEASPLPLGPIVAGIFVVGVGSGVVIGSAIARPGSLLARWFTKIISSLGVAKLFSRTAGPDVLKHPLRAQIHNLVAKEPGITISALATSMNVNRSTLRHHLKTLEREELIRPRPKAKACHLYPNGKEDQAGNSVSRDTLFYRHRADLAKEILDNPGLAQNQVAKRVGLPRSRVNLYTRALVEGGLVRVEEDGRYCRYFPTEALKAIREEGFLPGAGAKACQT